LVACFGLNSISFLFVIAAILALRDVHVPAMATESMVAQLKDGLRFVRDMPNLLGSLTMDSICGYFYHTAPY
jgi:hypothetical protein